MKAKDCRFKREFLEEDLEIKTDSRKQYMLTTGKISRLALLLKSANFNPIRYIS